MKKVLCIALIAALALGLFACNLINKATMETYDFETRNYTQATGDVSPTSAIDEINIDWVAGSVRVMVGTQDNITVHESGVGASASIPLCYRVNNAALSIAFAKDGTKIRNVSKTLVVTIPAEHLLTRLSVNAVAANVAVDPAVVGELNVDNVSGRVECTLNAIAKTRLNTMSGNVNLRAASTKEVEVETVSGTINLNLPIVDEVEAKSVSGNVTLALAKDASFAMNVSTASGRVSTGDFACTKSGSRYLSGTGKIRIEVETTSGDVTLKTAS